MKRSNLFWLSIAIISLSVAGLFGTFGVNAGDIPKELTKIQREGHRYYRIDRRTQTGIYNQGKVILERADVYKLLPKNAPGSCSHEVAIKIKLLREAGYDPYVGEYLVKVGDSYFLHAVAIIDRPGGGHWVFNNRGWFVHERDNMDGYRNLRTMTYEQARRRYTPNITHLVVIEPATK